MILLRSAHKILHQENVICNFQEKSARSLIHLSSSFLNKGTIISHNDMKNKTLVISANPLLSSRIAARRFSAELEANNNETKTICWKCRKQITSKSKFFCEHCQIIVPQENISYFRIFDMDEMFDIAILKLQEDFKNLQRIFHPDKFSLRSEIEKEISAQISTLINVAYKTLLDPLSRAVYLLNLNGITIEEDTQLNDSEFLMEMMELNEQIAIYEDAEELVKIQDEIFEKYNELIGNISASFKSNNLNEAKHFIIKLRYYNNITEKLKYAIPPS